VRGSISFERLSKIKLKDEKLDQALSKLIERFNRSTALRNEFNHCMYVTDESGQIAHTQSMRIVKVTNVCSLESVRLSITLERAWSKSTKEMSNINLQYLGVATAA